MQNATSIRIGLLLAIIVVVVLGALQGLRIDKIQDSESFYRWILTASKQMRLEGRLGSAYTDDGGKDAEVFEQVAALADSFLGESVPIEDDDLDANGETFGALLRAERQERDDDIWRLASSPEATEVRANFLQALQDGQLESAGVRFETASLYGEDTQVEGVGLTSLFFGFRHLAANFVWLQVDKHWHAGQMHRMLPLMQTSVALDPTFVDAYLLGAWHMAYNITAKMSNTPEPLKILHPKYKIRIGPKEEWYYIAIEFLKDGVVKNPRDYRLYFDLGYSIYEVKLSDHANAVRYLEAAVEQRHDAWVPRMLNLAYWRNGQYEDALEGWDYYIELFPDNPAAPRFIQINKGDLAEAKAAEALECVAAARTAKRRFEAEAEQARAAGDAARAAELEQQAADAADYALEMEVNAEIEADDARRIWQTLIETGDDSLAKVRLMKRSALEYIEEDGAQGALLAVAELDLARWELGDVFDEYSDLIIEIKQEFDVPLTISEQLQVERMAEAADYIIQVEKPRIYRYECPYRDEQTD